MPVAEGTAVAAARLFLRVDERDDASAHFDLGLMYYRGQGVPQDYAAAVSHFHKAAVQGHASAQTWLGLMYAMGQGVPRDFLQAYKWWSLATLKGNQQARKNLDNLTRAMTPEMLRRARQQTREWLAALDKRAAR